MKSRNFFKAKDAKVKPTRTKTPVQTENISKNTNKSDESDFIARVRRALFDADNSAHRETVDRIMDETGETAAEVAAALVGMLKKSPETKPPKKAPESQREAHKATAKPAPKAKRSEALPKRDEAAPKRAKPAEKPAAKAAKPAASDRSVRIMISGGKNKRFTHKDIVGALIARAGLSAEDMQGIQIRERQTILQVPSHYAERVISVMNSPDGKIKGVPVKAQMIKEHKK